MKTICKLIIGIITFGMGFNSMAQVATNYTFSQTSSTFSAITGGSVVGGPTDDDVAYSDLGIGFQFKYNGTCYRTFGMSSNGSFGFGSSYPGNGMNLLSTGTINDVIALLNSDLQLGTIAAATVVAGSPAAAILSTVGIAVGNFISPGYGFPAGTSVTAVFANYFSASAIATSNGAVLMRFSNGEMRYQTLGAAPNRTLVAQWLNERNYGGTSMSESFNFQLRLEETSNKISIVYGSFNFGSYPNVCQVGLRGNGTADFHNRATSTNWSATTAGLNNTDVCAINTNIIPANGLTFNWSTNLSVPVPTVMISVSGNTLHCGSQASGINFLFASGANSFTWSTGSANVPSYSVSTISSVTTVYTVVGIGANNCTSTNTIVIVVAPNPVIIINGANVICAGKSAGLIASGAASYSWSTGATSNSIAPSPSITSNYSVVGTSSVGCSLAASITVIVNPLPTLTVATSNSLICAGETVSITASGAITYTWSDGSGTAMIVVQPTATTVYTLTGKDGNGCENNTSMTQNVDACLGISQVAGGIVNWAIYPNPNSGEFFIESSHCLNLILINSLGQIILQQNLVNDKNKIDLNNQAKGIYFIHLNQNENVSRTKIIKE